MSTISITAHSQYTGQPSCVQSCLFNSRHSSDVVSTISCGEPWLDDCYCQYSSVRMASLFLSSCVENNCNTPSTAAIVTSALDAYRGYCNDGGHNLPEIVTMDQWPPYSRESACLRTCVWNIESNNDLMPAMSCTQPWAVSCMCNEFLYQTATNFLSSCVASGCATASTAPQVTSALNLHRSYCSENGFALPALAGSNSVSTPTGSSSSGSSGPSSPSNRGPNSPGQSDGQGGPGNPSGSAAPITDSGLSTGAIAGIAVGAVAAIAIIVGVAAFIMIRRRRQAAADAAAATPATTAANLPPTPGMTQGPYPHAPSGYPSPNPGVFPSPSPGVYPSPGQSTFVSPDQTGYQPTHQGYYKPVANADGSPMSGVTYPYGHESMKPPPHGVHEAPATPQIHEAPAAPYRDPVEMP